MPEQMYFNLGKIPKGMQQLLEGRGVNTWNEGREGERGSLVHKITLVTLRIQRSTYKHKNYIVV